MGESSGRSSAITYFDSHPLGIPVVMLIGCAVYVAVLVVGRVFHLYDAYPEAESLAMLGDVYIGFASAIAIVAGFAGVVVVFVYSAASKAFVSFRVTAEPELMENWRSVVVCTFTAALGFLASALVNVIASPIAAWCMAIFCLALTLDSVARVIRQFFVMLRIARADDGQKINNSKF
ncbi:hypothetical protein [Ancrocorticia sp.]|uniref:hypothetical protein n=1 Tax=Ancrocorticia sp. TaxID=2593684 RepID=UPI003F93BD24